MVQETDKKVDSEAIMQETIGISIRCPAKQAKNRSCRLTDISERSEYKRRVLEAVADHHKGKKEISSRIRGIDRGYLNGRR